MIPFYPGKGKEDNEKKVLFLGCLAVMVRDRRD